MVNVRTSMAAATRRIAASPMRRKSVNAPLNMAPTPRRRGFPIRNRAQMSDFDIVIVGGGIAGASLGARIAGKAQVAILEAEDHCAFHSTGRSAAFWLAHYGGPAVMPLTLASRQP